MRAIDGFSRILQEDHPDKLDGEALRLLNIIRDNSASVGRLIDDLLAFSRMGRAAMTLSPVDMESLAREALDELRAGADPGVARVAIGPIAETYSDRALLRQVWLNLLSDALKFSSKKPAPEIVGGALEEKNASCFVRDNGAGFNMDYYHKLFGVFQRLHSVRDFAASGVGLAIVQRVVSRHGGRVRAEGREGAGATFASFCPGKTAR